ncbi:hypothetical protein SAMN05444004_101125 [Jannaschia faecimaris]|uniref:Uncharacterized protein n=1 Tax=Jannaschia faecimaris TaxID=1244108 RepID=A0A1H3IW61_9RHOB|nr:hypothetical protein [Jannaschia faecimaris]SDY31807.1 hypothetical protein SAMN05444004_101125 [Jannaschia faecimaris]
MDGLIALIMLIGFIVIIAKISRKASGNGALPKRVEPLTRPVKRAPLPVAKAPRTTTSVILNGSARIIDGDTGVIQRARSVSSVWMLQK